MKKKEIIILFSLILAASAHNFPQATKVWETNEIFKGPESVAYDSARGLLYISNYTSGLKVGGPYGNHSIAKARLNGELMQLHWIKNITTPTGICIFKDKLYIVERFGVVEYDLKGDSVSNKYYIKTSNFLNDITVDPDTNIYVSESDSDVIYKIKNGKVEKWIESSKISRTNGILADGNKLIIGVISDSSIKAVDLAKKDISVIAQLKSGIIDGIKKCGSNYLVSHFEGNLYLVSSKGEIKELINTRNEKMNIADFEYIEDKKMIVIPALHNNKLLGFRYLPGD
jgi:DNA-binding beta-propeller fold protein YncE